MSALLIAFGIEFCGVLIGMFRSFIEACDGMGKAIKDFCRKRNKREIIKMKIKKIWEIVSCKECREKRKNRKVAAEANCKCLNKERLE